MLFTAYGGWNDAGSAATRAIEYLVEHLAATKFATIDPDRYYDFTQARPHTRPVGEFMRELTWPANNFFYAAPTTGSDVVLFVGTEPHLRWMRYGKAIVSLAQQVGVTESVSLGALLADTPHTRPVPLSGGSSTPDLGGKLQAIGIRSSKYEGPTGILSVVGTLLGEAGISNGSVWASVPHYISATPNPTAAAALVRQLNAVYMLDVPLGALDVESGAFQSQVETALADNPEAQQYVRQLELTSPPTDIQSYLTPRDSELDRPPGNGDSEPLDESQAEGLIASVEEFLRRRQREHQEDASTDDEDPRD